MEELKVLLERYKKYFILGAILLVLTIIVGVILSYSLYPVPKDELIQPKTTYSSSSFTSKTNKNTTASYVYVDVKGAIKEPGLYKISATKRVR